MMNLTLLTHRHDYGSNVAPGGDPVETRLVAGHLLDARGEPLHAENPPYCDRLEEAAPQDRYPACAVVRHEQKHEA